MRYLFVLLMAVLPSTDESLGTSYKPPIPNQQTEKKAVIQTLENETKFFCERNYTAWAATWVHEPHVLKSYSGNPVYSELNGWEQIKQYTQDYFREHPAPTPFPQPAQNVRVRLLGTGAWVSYERDDSVRGRKKELRLLEKQGLVWKIAFMTTIYYAAAPTAR